MELNMTPITAVNLDTGETHTYCGEPAEWAVVHSYCVEHKLSPWLCALRANKMLSVAGQSLPITRGQRTVACGAWCAVTEGTS